MGDKLLHYRIKYQDSNVVVIKFSKDDITDFLKNSLVWIENNEDSDYFWECFEEALFEIHGIAFVFIDGYEITVVKEFQLPNWGRIIENVIWCSIFFLNPDGGAIQMSKNGKPIGKLIEVKFSFTEPEYPHKK